NGITVVCDKFDYNSFQKNDFNVRLKNMQIINGGQTCKTIYETLKENSLSSIGKDSYVLIRIYQLDNEDSDFVQDITYATNSQNPVDLRDLRSNDDVQKTLEIGMRELGYIYKRKREECGYDPKNITSAIAAEATLAIWREKPHLAKFRHKEHFDRLYAEIFTNLTAAQAILAVLIFRDVENDRKRPFDEEQNPFIPYASHYIAMLVGRILLRTKGIALEDIRHSNFFEIAEFYRANRLSFYNEAVDWLRKGLISCYGNRKVSALQMAATFRRGDLLEMLS
ncbi:MAG: AIPR family protein, partial [Desulfovibrionaceae bacterium]|nr:AIPR family protein [Desulfovibrionaceae bacterium]